MSGPGSGRYTNYVPPASSRNKLLSDLFNAKAGEAGKIYGAAYQTDPAAAASAAVASATANVDSSGKGGLFPEDGRQAGDAQMFPQGTNLNFSDAPNTADVKWKASGDPANAFVPDISSPGPGKTSPLDKNADPKIGVSDVKGDAYVVGAPDTGTASPSATSPSLGLSPITKSLVMGKSSV